MKEIKKILEKYRSIDFSTRKAAIATVVRVEGSSYRRPGARMIMTDDGTWEGSISGGWWDRDALRKSRKAILQGKPIVVVYNAREESANKFGAGLASNDIIEVLIEPINEKDKSNPVVILEEIIESKEVAVVATIFEVEGDVRVAVGEKLIYSKGKVSNSIADELLNNIIIKELKDALSIEKSYTKTICLNKGVVRVFVEVVQPNIQMIIFGGGHDAIPLVNLAKEIGWEVTISDEYAAHLFPKRFPQADKIIFSTRDSVLNKLTITKRTAIVLLTHDYDYNKSLLGLLVGTEAEYIGMLGPRKRFENMLIEWKLDNIRKEALKKRVNSPIGLDIGAETPEEIAFSIITEIKAHFSNRAGGFLKIKTGHIHQRETEAVSLHNNHGPLTLKVNG